MIQDNAHTTKKNIAMPGGESGQTHVPTGPLGGLTTPAATPQKNPAANGAAKWCYLNHQLQAGGPAGGAAGKKNIAGVGGAMGLGGC